MNNTSLESNTSTHLAIYSTGLNSISISMKQLEDKSNPCCAITYYIRVG